MDSKRIDIGVGIVLCILSVAIFVYAGSYKGTGVSQYGPNFFPQTLAVLMFFFSALMIVLALRGRALKGLEPINKLGFIRATVTLVLAIIYLVAMQYLGFFLSTIIFLYVVMTYIGHRGQTVRIVSSLLVTAIIYGIFQFFLKIPLPAGLFQALTG